MSSLAIIGAQWGDEGKGKLVDYLTSNAEYVVRFQGGNNAGHTLVVGGVETKLRLIPSGILRPGTRCLVGAGVVVDAERLVAEIDEVSAAGVAVGPDRLVIDHCAGLVMPYHIVIDRAREAYLGASKIGTTGRGIGPAYEDRAARRGVRACELARLDLLLPRLGPLVDEKNRYLRHVLGSDETVDVGEVREVVTRAAERLVPFLGEVSRELAGAFSRGARVVFEGAQGSLLDNVFGTVPFVTSSATIAGGAAVGSGAGPKNIGHVLGVAKAYCTRVGEGPFPTELEGPEGERLRSRGHEFGTNTGRARRCGWFDGVAMRHAVRLSGIDSLAVTKLDVLAGSEKIKVCYRYRLAGRVIDHVPPLAEEFSAVEPEYLELDGWADDIRGATRWYELPGTARLFLDTVAELVGCPVSIVSVGAERSSTLFSSNAQFLRNFTT